MRVVDQNFWRIGHLQAVVAPAVTEITILRCLECDIEAADRTEMGCGHREVIGGEEGSLAWDRVIVGIAGIEEVLAGG